MKGSSGELHAALMSAASNIAHQPVQIFAQDQATDPAVQTEAPSGDIVFTGIADTLNHAEPSRDYPACYGATVA